MIKLFTFFLLFIPHVWAQNIAVVIVDMQYGFYTRGRVLQTDGVIQLILKQQELLLWARSKKLPVLFFEYHGFQETDFALTGTLWGYKFKTITKYDDNGFQGRSRREAIQFLQAHEVDTLIIAGINASGCGKRTAQGALELGFDVLSAGDVVADLYQNPPHYPQAEWFIDDLHFKGFKTFSEIRLYLESAPVTYEHFPLGLTND
jgi:nicotinamidase-related amidase